MSFVEKVVARSKEEGVEVVAGKNLRKAVSSVDAEIAMQGAKVVDLEQELADAQENYESAIYPTTLIKDGKTYLNIIRSAKLNVESATANLNAVKDFIKELQQLKAEHLQ